MKCPFCRSPMKFRQYYYPSRPQENVEAWLCPNEECALKRLVIFYAKGKINKSYAKVIRS